MVDFKPFADDVSALTIGGLSIENDPDRVTLSGSLVLARDRRSLDHARALRAALDEIIAAWKPLKPVLDKAVSGDRLSFMEREAVFNGMNDLTAMATDLSSAYARALK